MFLNTKAPAILATTALMILRNQLSERVWGAHGVNTLAIDDPRPKPAGRRGVRRPPPRFSQATRAEASPGISVPAGRIRSCGRRLYRGSASLATASRMNIGFTPRIGSPHETGSRSSRRRGGCPLATP